jgi:tRNA threonylcarbamoyl adenosine modification protein YeaZ
MHSYIVIQNTYDVFAMALFINNKPVDQLSEDKRHTSKLLIPLLDQLLARNNITFSDLSFCAVNCGPGPFSTLRSVIASVNGLHLATNIPLIGIDGLDATFLEFYDNNYANTVVLLNAFNNEVYYLIFTPSTLSFDGDPKKEIKNVVKGYHKIDAFIATIMQQCAGQPIHFIGNGVTLHHDLIKQTCGNTAVIKENNPPMCSLETIGRLGLEKFMHENKSDGYLMPLHLKKHAVEL